MRKIEREINQTDITTYLHTPTYLKMLLNIFIIIFLSSKIYYQNTKYTDESGWWIKTVTSGEESLTRIESIFCVEVTTTITTTKMCSQAANG